MTNVVIASAARTAVGSFGGSFANTPAHDLGAAVLDAVVLAMVVSYGRLDRRAGACIVPYALWLGLATAINVWIVRVH